MYKATPQNFTANQQAQKAFTFTWLCQVASSYCRVCKGLYVIFCPVLITRYMKASTVLPRNCL